MDAKNGYWSVHLDDESSKLTTFNTPFGRYRFLRLPFGLVVSQDVFQQRMDAILEQCPGCIGIADDVAVYGRDKEEHDRNLINLMRVAEKEGLVFNSQKCIVRANEIPFFGMIYSADGARPDPARIEAIQSLPAPENVTELQEFLGIATYMATFVPRLSHHTATLRELLKQDTEFSWTAAHDQEFRKVKDLICRETTLAYFDPNQESVLQVDSSLHGLGAVLMQEGRPIAFASKSLTDTESRYANIERELLALVYGCERFHTYLYGKPFTAQSDHKPLEMIQLKNLHAAPPRLQRMLLRLQNYDVTIKYQPGKTLLLADGLSWLPGAKQSAEIKLDVAINLVHFSQERVQELRDKTARDPILAPLRDLIISGWPDTFKQVTKPLRPYWSYRDELSIEDGIILKGSEQVLIPAAMQEYILDALHAGHQGRDKCQLRAKRSVFWNGINDDIAKCVAKCPICQEEASSQRKEPLVQKDIPPRAWHTISADFFDLMGKEYLLVADHFSKFPFIKCLPWDCSSKTTQETLKALFSVHGAPEILYTDNGPQFVAYSFAEFCDEWNVQHITSSPHYPQSNGFIESMVKTVKKTLRRAHKSHMDPQMALLCLRTTPVSSTLPSPMEMLMGRKAKSNLPVSIRNTLNDRDSIHQALLQRQATQAANYNSHAGPQLANLYIGQGVRVQDHLDGTWTVAKVIEKCDEPRSFVVETPNGSRIRRNRRHIRDIPNHPNFHRNLVHLQLPGVSSLTMCRKLQNQFHRYHQVLPRLKSKIHLVLSQPRNKMATVVLAEK